MSKQIINWLCLAAFLHIVSICRADDFKNFITRKGDRLYDGDKAFRFIGVNLPGINAHYEGYKNTNPASKFAYDPTELTFEMEGYFTDMSQMGVTVFRNWGISVSDGSDDYEAQVTGNNTYNETAWRRIDKMLELCNRDKVRVIFCLVKENSYWGGTAAFSKLYGGGDYYTSAAIRQGFRDLLTTIANRKNFYTGTLYKNDKAILAWEFGNEVPNDKIAWIDEMSTYLKSIDPNHLIADPRRANGPAQMSTFVDDVLNRCKNIDFVKTRQYPNYRGTVDSLWAVCEGKIPMILDEFQRMEGFEKTLERVDKTGTSGALLWSLMKYQFSGGIGGHALLHSYSWGGSRWPGFNSGAYFDEEKNLQLIRAYAYRIRNEAIPPLPAPAGKPYLYANLQPDVAALKWRSAPGSRYYVVERASSKGGPWSNVSGDIDISYNLFFYPMFTDSSANTGASYYYRVRGKNASGTTPPSNVIGPVLVKQRMVLDNLLDFSKVYSKSDNLVVSDETWPRLRQTEEEFSQVVKLPGTATGEMVYKAKGLRSIKIIAFTDRAESVQIEHSEDGVSWQKSQQVQITTRQEYPSVYSGTTNNPVTKQVYDIRNFPKETTFVKLTLVEHGGRSPWIGRVYLGFTGSLVPAP